MPILPIDSGRYGSKEMKDIFEEYKKLEYELKFEAAVAKAQAEINLIPKEAVYRNSRNSEIKQNKIKQS